MLLVLESRETCGREIDRRSGCDEKEGEGFNLFVGSIMTSGSLKISQAMVVKCWRTLAEAALHLEPPAD
jgi:hypothetical protein